jgi:hypothetical protein
MHRVAAVIELGSLGRLKFGLCASVQFCQASAGGACGGLAGA